MSTFEPSSAPRRAIAGGPWRPVTWLPTVDSTNAYVRRAPQLWQVVVAAEQTEGRGRLGRGWTTTPGASLAVSVLLPRPKWAPLGWAPLAVGVSVCRALADASSVQGVLKWPNDVLVPADDDRKIAGILTELTPQGVIVGVGVNLSQQRADLPIATATSIAAAGGGSPVSRETMLAAYLARLDEAWRELDRDLERLQTAYRDMCTTLGRTVAVQLTTATLRGTATGIDPDGSLRVASGKGSYAVAAGDVVHVR